MSKRRTGKDRDRPKKQPTGDYETGYCRPPKHGQTKRDEVRNPWGPKGKPKPEQIDAFEFAASQPTTIRLQGEEITVPAEVASHLINMQAAVAGNQRAHKNVQDERRARRGGGPAAPTAQELEQQRRDEERSKVLRARLVELLEWQASKFKSGELARDERGLDLAPWVREALADYRARHGGPPEPESETG